MIKFIVIYIFLYMHVHYYRIKIIIWLNLLNIYQIVTSITEIFQLPLLCQKFWHLPLYFSCDFFDLIVATLLLLSPNVHNQAHLQTCNHRVTGFSAS